ncbi:chemotaxis-specific protein-glutamate methyltransferase CheB [Halobacteria archaeon AArc-m2/3/4]|uniref:Protein-glutamate methylesterase/protein-glutamine glutaminase n=1 Tax=Natronoglomus mannanivorans TaxID=2979990 RepID=A0AAP3E043_9EURY|nr:chemotaxis-specific protein-glutamate methyltransferase CheB [Halobacteria archaeon AArc-xg1-1]MCU4971795.1 chemotaxis-specific protein-glutamate methyltransferase CheB [Halobacteria archaeon AArc-m2/3/4]
MTQILVVDDSQFMRTVIGNALSEAGYDVETAADGHEAVRLATTIDPDVVTMDVEMPGMSGIDAVERIMATNPTSILMLSAYTERGADATLDALERGAVDFLHKPDGSGSRNIAHLVDSVVETVDDLAEADVSSLALARAAAAVRSTEEGSARLSAGAESRPQSRLESDVEGDAVADSTQSRSRPAVTTTRVDTAQTVSASGPSAPTTAAFGTNGARNEAEVELEDDGDRTYCDDPTLVVGASTGGPKIIEHVLRELPIDLGAKVIVVQHMPADFTARFADRLDKFTSYRVREARDGIRVESGDVVVAQGGAHLAVTNNVGGWLRVRFDGDERINGVRPSIDVTMTTAADRVRDPLVGVVLTGMGKDGAAGIEAIKRAGGRTIAQDEATSPVFGIPRQAIETGCVDEVAPADELVDRICAAFRTETDGETNG